MKAVYSIIEREGKKPFWQKVGVAFENKDGSLNVILNCIPLDGKLHIRDENKKEGQYNNDRGDNF
jgi:hypothetical protein